MGPPSYMRFVVDRNVFMRRILIVTSSGDLYTSYACFVSLHCHKIEFSLRCSQIPWRVSPVCPWTCVPSDIKYRQLQHLEILLFIMILFYMFRPLLYMPDDGHKKADTIVWNHNKYPYINGHKKADTIVWNHNKYPYIKVLCLTVFLLNFVCN